MANTFVVSDTHFGHAGVCRFMCSDGVTKLRPWDDYQAMDEAMIAKWNSVVKPCDKVYHLGDVVINRRALPTLARLNGDKVLIKGNHDIFRINEYLTYFRDIRAYHVYNNLIFSHIPIHPESRGRFSGNVHGHLHSNQVLDARGQVDPWYLCVCVEQTDFQPLPIESVFEHYRKHGFLPQKELSK